MISAQYWLDRLTQLEETVTEKDKLTTQEIITWVADCVSVFNALGVSHEIIGGFLRIFENVPTTINRSWRDVFEYWENPARQKDRVTGFMNVGSAFAAARALALSMREEERFIPKKLIDLLKSKYPAISATLENIEKAHENKDANSMIVEANSLLDLIIQLSSGLPTQKKGGKRLTLKGKIDAIKADKTLLLDFGVNSELIELLSDFRYLRNTLGPHKTLTTGNPHFAIGHGFSSLVILFLNGVMQAGKLIIIS